ncbi:hypothetical protein POX_d04977 [Penicillium oxalicum]|uniref:hypothetical protein n=1 Tax=Penicillium oxalicum TaxID=69781 RepID=UPI0020B76E5E|nr:hypothetical protein POX_d04977 [Penicillium oxalicum]KAI2789485.1 hypothetical protein POX_d04977 [Penicillium oxalicum]
MPDKKATSGPANLQAAEALTEVHDSLKVIQEDYDKFRFGFPHSIRTMGAINDRELSESIRLLTGVALKASNLRKKLEANDPKNDFLFARSKLWDVEGQCGIIVDGLQQQASAHHMWLETMRIQTWDQISAVTNTLQDPWLEPLQELQRKSLHAVKKQHVNPRHLTLDYAALARTVKPSSVSRFTEHPKSPTPPSAFMENDSDTEDDPFSAHYRKVNRGPPKDL